MTDFKRNMHAVLFLESRDLCEITNINSAGREAFRFASQILNGFFLKGLIKWNGCLQ